MKNLHKIVSLLLVAALLLTGSTVALASGILTEEITLTGLNDLAVRQAARSYMDIRADFLLGEIDSMDWLLSGIDDDEAAHLKKCATEGVMLIGSDYSVVSVECYDTEAYVTVNETVSYWKDGVAGTELVVHEMTVIYDNNVTFVISDRYMENFSGFESCSYVPPMAENNVYSVGNPVGSAPCIIKIALGEEGYTETGVNVTKYADDLETTQTAWCSIFIRWCAYKANISENVIPLRPACVDLRAFYQNAGLYYTRASGYIPEPGDIFFKLTSDGNHVGIVEKVEGNLVWIIHGNASNKVKHNTMNINSTEIVGYAHPNYGNTVHTYTTYEYIGDGSHFSSCINCGAELEEVCHMIAHSNNSVTHTMTCSHCSNSYTEAHSFILNQLLGIQICSDCGYSMAGPGVLDSIIPGEEYVTE